MTSSPLALITGRARFVDDELPPGTLHAGFVRSFLAHARLLGVDSDLAASSPGVVAVHTAQTLGAPDIPAQIRASAPAARGMERPIIARDRVRFVGEAVAMVLADRAEQAFDAAEMVWPDLEALPAVVDPVQAIGDEILLFPEAGTNVVARDRRGSEGPEPDGPVIVEIDIRHKRLAAVPIEPLGILAVPEGDNITVWCSHQRPHDLLASLEQAFPVKGRIRVSVPDVGGAFGLKGQLYPEYFAVVAAALLQQRPVLWRERRREHFSSGNHGRGMSHHVRLVGDSTGLVRGITIEIVADQGAYPQAGFIPPKNALQIGAGPYLVDFVHTMSTSVVTNTAPTGPYRGAGRPEAAAALERTIDVYARRIQMDPIEVRRRNLIPASAMPFANPTGAVYDGGDYQRALEMAADLIDVPKFRAEQGERRRSGHDSLLGLGIATFVEPAGGSTASGEYGKVEIERDGTICIRTGSTSAGQPHALTWRRVVAELFDADPASIRFVSGDTAEIQAGVGTFGSRSTQLGAVAVVRTGRRVLERAKEIAAALLEASPSDIRVESGGFAVAGVPDLRVELREVAERAHATGEGLFAEEMYDPGAQTFPYGTHAAVVEVSRETGAVRILRIVAVDDCGNILDPSGVAGQLYGGLAQGIGQALFEEVEYREDGQLLSGSLMDYQLPRAADIPPIILGHLATPAANELGVKGVGESGVIGLPVAILNAVMDALGGDGMHDVELPLRPAQLWEALRVSPREPA